MSEETAKIVAVKYGGTVYGRAGFGETGFGVSIQLRGMTVWVWEWSVAHCDALNLLVANVER